jgi:hypothetical protein
MSAQLTELHRLQTEMRKANEQLFKAAEPLKRLSEMSPQEREKLGDELQARAARWESIVDEIQLVLNGSDRGRNEGETR